MFRLACIIIGYFIGCIQSAYFVGRAMKVDIRKHGSGNLGSTNALRVLGKRAGALTFTLDILKSVAACIICRMVFKDNYFLAGMYGCAGAVLGHDFPFYLKFKGGKGIAVMIGMMLTVFSTPTLVAFGIGILFCLSGYVSLGSLAFSVAIPVALGIFGYPREVVILTLCLVALAFFNHRANIKRLLNGNENKLGAKKVQ